MVSLDDKKFNLDGPDGLKMYWHDLQKRKPTFLTRHQVDASILVWGAI